MDHHQAGRLAEAEEIYRQILDAAPDYPDALNLLGVTILQRDAPEEAIHYLGRAAELYPQTAPYHINLGHAYREAGHFGEAVECYHRVLELEPQAAEIHAGLGDVLQLQDKLDEAVASYGRALELGAGDGEIHSNLGNALRALGRHADALDACLRAVDLAPGLASAHFNLGNVLHELGRPEEALNCYKRALEILPGDAETYFCIHACVFDDHNLEPAADALEQALALDPSHRLANFNLGVIRDLSGDGRAAARCFGRLDSGEGTVDPLLDSWEFAGGKRTTEIRFFANTFKTLEFGLGAAIQEGLVLEFGVRYGTTLTFIAGIAGQPVHGFDSFEGLPESWNQEPTGTYTTFGNLPAVPANASLHVGWFSDSLPGFMADHPGPVRFLHIDSDLYSSAKTILDNLAPRIVPGTVIVFDEYLVNKNWRQDEHKAFQETATANKWNYDFIAFSMFTKQAVVLIK